MTRLASPHDEQRGFTLVEAIMVIVITGIIGSMLAVFIKTPVDAYIDAARRAELTDAADTAVRRISRELRLALPNSVRNPSGASGSDQCIEFIPTRTGARYRSAAGAAGDDLLDFGAVDASFDMLWNNDSLLASEKVTAGDVIVVYNDGSATGDAYTGGNAIQVAGIAAGSATDTSTLTFVGVGTNVPFNRKQFPAESPAMRFQVIPSTEHVAGFGCSGGVLYRYSRTLSAARTRPADCTEVATGATAATLVRNVGSCSIKYEPPGSTSGAWGRAGIVTIALGITHSGESVQIYHQVHVDNVP